MQPEYTPVSEEISWLGNTPNGLYCRAGSFFLDPRGASRTAVISHAHGDHFPNGVREIYATATTLALRKEQARRDLTHTRKAIAYGEVFRIGEVQLRLFAAGHVPGSAQIEMKFNGQRVIYSGDIQTKALPNCEPLQFPEAGADLLLCESTFGHSPLHPESPDDELSREIALAGSKSLLLGTYPLGKAQRLTLMLNRIAPGLPVVLHQDIFSVSNTLSGLGYATGTYKPYQKRGANRHIQHAFLVPPRILSSYAMNDSYHRLFASGWPQRERMPWLDGDLRISDHADREGLLKYIERLNPKSVVWVHGDGMATQLPGS